MIKRAIVCGIVSAGAKARDVRELPVPVTQWATLDADCAAGIHVLVSPLDQRSADIRFFDTEGLQIDKRAERKLENLLFREDFRRAGFYEMGDIEYGEPIAGYIRASVQVGGRGHHSQRGLPRAHRLRLQRCVGGAPGDPQRARGHDDPTQRRDARGWAPP